ncbi:DUF3073 domain-containing protein [Candidatus Aquiluna sp. UB-MaderosW2red]|jgi:hypothetical protein|uniref:DUF3073 domain-containing protein n=1 Tax=Candidatus Aquiluna sp. UB-MaderosW2red TaxID=1855377 RepID=UPI000875DC05|nr:DUF3073 domain-containing protein [Candidatus Aquiluna sp. UB-MaderosW2red]SCX02969.1 Protein of unknown function [Candidatus Aquiluna sp. UB-MaderosW2red]
MGRGRQKAKNTKVARDLKYFSPSTDYSALEAELSHKSSDANVEYIDKWADLYDDEAEEVEKDEVEKDKVAHEDD